MEYFLTVDKGTLYNYKGRYKKIDLSKINPSLSKENNLEAICTFTSSFDTSMLLKEFLHKNKLIDIKDMPYDLVILKDKDYDHSFEVAYKQDLKFLNVRYLQQILFVTAKNPDALRIITNYYNRYKNLTFELESLRSYMANPYADHKLDAIIRSFISKLCYKTLNGKRVKKYQEIYELGMLMSKLTNKNKHKTVDESQIEASKTVKYTEDDPRLHHLEELEERRARDDDQQIRLF